MLSDEEKKAYDNLIMLKYFTMEKEDKQAIDIILNLIEKQSKEIEELKKYEKGYKLLSYSLDNYISKDKIKAKIEEIKEEVKTCIIYKKTGLCTNNCKEDCEYYDFIDILQSLLEEENK